jgi:hypothetical protein
MDAKDEAAGVAAMAALTVGWALAKRVVGNKAVKTAVVNAGESAAKAAVAGATKSAINRGSTYPARRREDRKHRRLATDLARQIGGQVSLGTVIAADRYHVVWRSDEPVDCFPTLPKNLGPLNERFELTSFVGPRVTPRRVNWRLRRSAPALSAPA